MVVVNDVFWKIRDMSERTLNPRTRIFINHICQEMFLIDPQIVPILKELKRRRLIDFCKPGNECVKLTMLGFAISRTEGFED